MCMDAAAKAAADADDNADDDGDAEADELFGDGLRTLSPAGLGCTI